MLLTRFDTVVTSWIFGTLQTKAGSGVTTEGNEIRRGFSQIASNLRNPLPKLNLLVIAASKSLNGIKTGMDFVYCVPCHTVISLSSACQKYLPFTLGTTKRRITYFYMEKVQN